MRLLTLFSSWPWETRGPGVTYRSGETKSSSPAKFAHRTGTALRTCRAELGYINFLYMENQCLVTTLLRNTVMIYWLKL